jgi:hypothetical protein
LFPFIIIIVSEFYIYVIVRENYTSKTSAVALGTWLQMIAEIGEKFEILSEELDSSFWGLKHCVVAWLATDVSKEFLLQV